jgi:hypothetical protein
VEHGLKDWELCLAVRESAHRGNAWVDLPLVAETEAERIVEAEYLARYGHDPVAEPERVLSTTFTRSGVLWKVGQWL